MKKTILSVLAVAAAGSVVAGAFSDPGPEWPMWGGTADRNMVSSMKGLPTTWDLKSRKNVKWMSEPGPQT
ncbi:MAG: hypothetical protein H0W08_01520, partial [Acidobacteria bacterium]|nr:hypothetical protein [Acidobacteriota bacterium]